MKFRLYVNSSDSQNDSLFRINEFDPTKHSVYVEVDDNKNQRVYFYSKNILDIKQKVKKIIQSTKEVHKHNFMEIEHYLALCNDRCKAIDLEKIQRMCVTEIKDLSDWVKQLLVDNGDISEFFLENFGQSVDWEPVAEEILRKFYSYVELPNGNILLYDE